MRRSIALALVLAFGFVAGAPLAATGPSRPGDESANVLLTLTVVDTTEDGESSRHSVSALALEDRSARMVTGWRLPIPESTLDSATHFSYQDVGLAATLKGRVVGFNRVRVSGRVEVSAVDEEASAEATAAPRLGTFRHDFEVVVNDGVDSSIAVVTQPAGGSLSLSISAAIQDDGRSH